MCKCVEAFDKQMKSRNTKVSMALVLADNRMVPIIATSKVDTKKKGKPVHALSSYCPFCGSPLDETEVQK